MMVEGSRLDELAPASITQLLVDCSPFNLSMRLPYLLDTSHPNHTASLDMMLFLVRFIRTSMGWLL